MRLGNSHTRALVGIMAATLVGCGAGIKYNSDYDATVNFGGLQTYAWMQPKDANANRGVDQFTERRIIDAVDNLLAQQGYGKATTGAPDLLVNFIVTMQDKVDFNTYYTGWGYGPWYGGGTTTTVNQWTEGTLILDFVNPKTGDLAWRGWARGAIEPDLTPQERTRRINDVIAGIMKQYPPGS